MSTRAAELAKEIRNSANGAKPDRRAELESQIVVTEHGEFLTVLELVGKIAWVDSDADGNWWCKTTGSGVESVFTRHDTKQSAITAARKWLVDRAMEKESERA